MLLLSTVNACHFIFIRVQLEFNKLQCYKLVNGTVFSFVVGFAIGLRPLNSSLHWISWYQSSSHPGFLRKDSVTFLDVIVMVLLVASSHQAHRTNKSPSASCIVISAYHFDLVLFLWEYPQPSDGVLRKSRFVLVVPRFVCFYYFMGSNFFNRYLYLFI